MKSAEILPTKIQFLTILGSLVLVALLGATNYWLGWEYSFAIFYLLPIFMCVHYVGKWSGLLLALVAGVTWLAIELRSNPHSHVIVCYWNGLALLGFFVIFALLMSSVESSLKREQAINRNLETLLTLAPMNEGGWLAPSAAAAPGQPAGSPGALVPPPPLTGALPFEKEPASDATEKPQ